MIACGGGSYEKKHSIFILALFLAFFGSLCETNAAPLEKLVDSDDYNEVCQIADDIVRFVNGGPVDEEVTRHITVEDIDFDNALKEYSDVPFFTDKLKETSEVSLALDNSSYLWIIPIRVDGYLYEAFIGRAVDENQKFTGDWRIKYAAAYAPGNLTMEEQLRASLDKNGLSMDNYDFKLVCGVIPIRWPIFIALDENGAAYVIPARGTAAAITNSSVETRSNVEIGDEGKGSSDLDGYNAYAYEPVLTAVEEMKVNAVGDGGGTAVLDIAPKQKPFMRYAAIGGAGLVLVLVTYCIVRKKKSNKDSIS